MIQKTPFKTEFCSDRDRIRTYDRLLRRLKFLQIVDPSCFAKIVLFGKIIKRNLKLFIV